MRKASIAFSRFFIFSELFSEPTNTSPSPSCGLCRARRANSDHGHLGGGTGRPVDPVDGGASCIPFRVDLNLLPFRILPGRDFLYFPQEKSSGEKRAGCSPTAQSSRNLGEAAGMWGARPRVPAPLRR